MADRTSARPHTLDGQSRAAWWWLSGRDRIAARGLLPGLSLAAAWRAGHGSVGGHGNAA
ncbi:hypothetical protein ACIP46_34835 [Streptomyces lavendulae]|uniref:hypothetical protein n=1 Tax=Streptomyces lavendulae TaxID=1914 RepID=UPI0038010894